MLWAPLRGDWSDASHARHDLILMGLGSLGLQSDREPRGLASGFTASSLEASRKRTAAIRRLNPRAVILAELPFYEYRDEWLPEDHPWWLRQDGQRQQFWPGTHRMDWNQAAYREHVVQQAVALREAGVDGVFFDNLRPEPEPWTAFLRSLREAVGDGFLVQANAGYAVGAHDFAAPFLNGIMYESGWSHKITDWDVMIRKMRHSESLLRTPRISVIERFEEVRSRAGWPGDAKRGEKPPPDPAARRWTLCFSLVVGDFYYLFSDNTSHRHDWYAEYDGKIGQALEDGRRLGSHAWARQLCGGRGLCEPARRGVSPGGGGPDRGEGHPERRSWETFAIPPGDGRVLVPAGAAVGAGPAVGGDGERILPDGEDRP